MSLSIDTVLLFASLIPGLILRFCLYHGSIIHRPIFAGNPIYSGLVVAWYTSLAHLLATVFAAAIYLALYYLFYYSFFIAWTVRPHETLIWISEVTVKPHAILLAAGYIVWASLVAYFAAGTITNFSGRSLKLKQILFGRYADFVNSDDETDLAFAFVLTKEKFQDRTLSYAGIVQELGISEGSKIEYIVLDVPVKFFHKLGRVRPETTFSKGVNVGSTEDNVVGRMFIDGKEIQNLYLERVLVD